MSEEINQLEHLIKSVKETEQRIVDTYLPMQSAQFYCIVAEFDRTAGGTDIAVGSYPTATTQTLTSASYGTNVAANNLKVVSPKYDFIANSMVGEVASDVIGVGTAQTNMFRSGTPSSPHDLYRVQVFDGWRNRNWFPKAVLGSVIFGRPRRPYVFPKNFIIPSGTTLQFTITNLAASLNTTAVVIRLAQFMIAGYLLNKSSHRFNK